MIPLSYNIKSNTFNQPLKSFFILKLQKIFSKPIFFFDKEGKISMHKTEVYLLSGFLGSGKTTLLKALAFGGKEKTYQAWYGTPESVINGDRAEIEAYADRNYIFGEARESLLNDGRTYNYYTYENEVDNYQQDHYQLHFNHKFNPRLKLNVFSHIGIVMDE